MAEAASEDGEDAAVEDMVDWELAVTTARRLMRPGPEVTRDEARTAVADLRTGAANAEGHVRSYTQLEAASATAPVVVVDRLGWVQANADGFRVVLRPLVKKLRETRGSSSGIANALGPRVTGVEAGTLLAFLSGKVLGQFDPFWAGANGAATTPTAGRLLLVAPNVVQAERELDVDPRAFRLWVCLHEETHRVQFTAVPWLRDHMRDQIAELVEATEVDPAKLAALARDGLDKAVKLLRGDGVSLLDMIQTPEQRAILDRLTAVMSLLEGHADVVMDGVGPQVVPDVEIIRKRFQRRRESGSALDQLLRRLIGLDAKMRQYRDGARFVRGVVDQVGMAGFNAVWTSPETLPDGAEIADPPAWVRRVHG